MSTHRGDLLSVLGAGRLFGANALRAVNCTPVRAHTAGPARRCNQCDRPLRGWWRRRLLWRRWRWCAGLGQCHPVTPGATYSVTVGDAGYSGAGGTSRFATFWKPPEAAWAAPVVALADCSRKVKAEPTAVVVAITTTKRRQRQLHSHGQRGSTLRCIQRMIEGWYNYNDLQNDANDKSVVGWREAGASSSTYNTFAPNTPTYVTGGTTYYRGGTLQWFQTWAM